MNIPAIPSVTPATISPRTLGPPFFMTWCPCAASLPAPAIAWNDRYNGAYHNGVETLINGDLSNSRQAITHMRSRTFHLILYKNVKSVKQIPKKRIYDIQYAGQTLQEWIRCSSSVGRFNWRLISWLDLNTLQHKKYPNHKSCRKWTKKWKGIECFLFILAPSTTMIIDN